MEESSMDDSDFADYAFTACDPGWKFTYAVIGICTLINLALPIVLCFSKRQSDDGVVEENEEDDSPQSDISQSEKCDRNTNKDAESTSSDNSQVSIFSAASSAAFSVASKVLEARSNKQGHHRRKRKAGRRSNGQKGVSLDGVERNKPKPMEQEKPLPRYQQLIEAFFTTATWDKEMKKIISLWIPYSISGAAEGVSQTFIIGIVSHFIGLDEANAFVVVTILVEFTDTLTYGFAEAIGVLGPQADGAGNDLLVGRYMQLGLIFYTIGSLPGILLWTFYTKQTVLWFGFDEETAIIAQNYAYPFLAGTLFHATGEVMDAYLEIKGHERISMWVELGSQTIATLSVLAMAMMGLKDMFLIGTIQVTVDLLLTAVFVVYVLYKGWLDECWEGLAQTSGLKDKKAVKNILTTAVPLGISWILTYGEWEVMTLFASHMGPAEVAAWGILGFVWDTFEYIIDGLADASEVRVGFRMGAGDFREAKESAYKGMYLGVVISIYASGILLTISTNLVQWLTPDPTLQRIIFDLLPLIAFGQVSMSIGMVCWNILGAQGRVRFATFVEFVVSWIVVMPIAAILVYRFNFNLVGMVGSLDVGYTLGGVIITYLLVSSNWECLSKAIIRRNGGTICYDEFDWDDLPADVQTAATTLGYTRVLWDEGVEPPSSDKDWAELRTNERKAATLLGYDQVTWDNDSTKVKEDASGTYENYDFNELPHGVQEAAKVLGYTPSMWDYDKEPYACNKDWNRLTADEKEAATKLGYNKVKWESNGDISGDPNYDSLTWRKLPAGVQEAAEVLGYTPKMWNNDKDPATCDKDWDNLTSQEREAALKLGYDKKRWENETESKSYDDLTWRKLPSDVQEAAKALGYTPTMWNNDQEPDTCKKDWINLTSREREAAVKLGYDEKGWRNESDGKSYDDLKWKKLPVGVKEAAKVLGYTSQMWSNDQEPDTCQKIWEELSSDERDAASKLGYTNSKWSGANEYQVPVIEESENHASSSVVPQRTETALDYKSDMRGDSSSAASSTLGSDRNYSKCDNFAWIKLPVVVQEAATTLGYTPQMWNNNEEPTTCARNWSDLSAVERKAARILGYDEIEWDGATENSC